MGCTVEIARAPGNGIDREALDLVLLFRELIVLWVKLIRLNETVKITK